MAGLTLPAIASASLINTDTGTNGFPITQYNATGTYATNTSANIANVAGSSQTLATFESNLASAYSAGTGGAITFDAGNDETFVGNSGNPSAAAAQTISYATSKTLLINAYTGSTTATGLASNLTANGNGSGQSIYVSVSSGGGASSGTSTNPGYFSSANPGDFTFGAPSDGSKILTVGLTVIGRSGTNASGVGLEAYYSNGSNSGFVDLSGQTYNTNADVFYAFTAPSGAYITSIGFNLGSRPLGIDGLGFLTGAVAAPEPASAGFVVIAAAATLLRRRAVKPERK
jgi:hypothetical protein